MNESDFVLSFGEMISFLGFILTLVIFMGGALFRLWNRTTINARSLDTFRLEVAKEYVNSSQLQDLEKQRAVSEERIIGSISTLTARIDRWLDRQDR